MLIYNNIINIIFNKKFLEQNSLNRVLLYKIYLIYSSTFILSLPLVPSAENEKGAFSAHIIPN